MIDFKSKVFFIIFFSLIIISIGFTYKTIVIEGRYNSFSENDDIPRASDFYINLFEKIL